MSSLIVIGGNIRSKIRGLGRAMNRLRKETMVATGKFWHDNMLGRHFQTAAKFQYQFERRHPITLEKKREQGVEAFVDLVLSGRSERYMRHGERITATANRGRVKMDAPFYFTFRETAEHPDMPSEATAANDRDRKELASFMSADFTRRIANEQQRLAMEKVT